MKNRFREQKSAFSNCPLNPSFSFSRSADADNGASGRFIAQLPADKPIRRRGESQWEDYCLIRVRDQVSATS